MWKSMDKNQKIGIVIDVVLIITLWIDIIVKLVYR